MYLWLLLKISGLINDKYGADNCLYRCATQICKDLSQNSDLWIIWPVGFPWINPQVFMADPDLCSPRFVLTLTAIHADWKDQPQKLNLLCGHVLHYGGTVQCGATVWNFVLWPSMHSVHISNKAMIDNDCPHKFWTLQEDLSLKRWLIWWIQYSTIIAVVQWRVPEVTVFVEFRCRWMVDGISIMGQGTLFLQKIIRFHSLTGTSNS